MRTDQRIIKHRIGLLNLAQDLGCSPLTPLPVSSGG